MAIEIQYYLQCSYWRSPAVFEKDIPNTGPCNDWVKLHEKVKRSEEWYLGPTSASRGLSKQRNGWRHSNWLLVVSALAAWAGRANGLAAMWRIRWTHRCLGHFMNGPRVIQSMEYLEFFLRLKIDHSILYSTITGRVWSWFRVVMGNTGWHKRRPLSRFPIYDVKCNLLLHRWSYYRIVIAFQMTLIIEITWTFFRWRLGREMWAHRRSLETVLLPSPDEKLGDRIGFVNLVRWKPNTGLRKVDH